jgi:hypothetical protein
MKFLQGYSYLRDYSEDFMNEIDLSQDIIFFDLAFANHIHRFISLNRLSGSSAALIK